MKTIYLGIGSNLGDRAANLQQARERLHADGIKMLHVSSVYETAPRDIYCGSIGWIAPNGQMQFNVAIRTLTLYPEGEAVFNIGGGVVYDSTAKEEYAECLLKARFALGNTTISS